MYTDENGTVGGKGGWTVAGMDAFNIMFKMVLEDRKRGERETMENEFVDVWIARDNKGLVSEHKEADYGKEKIPKRSLETSMFASFLEIEDEHEAHEKKRNMLEDVSNLVTGV